MSISISEWVYYDKNLKFRFFIVAASEFLRISKYRSDGRSNDDDAGKDDARVDG